MITVVLSGFYIKREKKKKTGWSPHPRKDMNHNIALSHVMSKEKGGVKIMIRYCVKGRFLQILKKIKIKIKRER